MLLLAEVLRAPLLTLDPKLARAPATGRGSSWPDETMAALGRAQLGALVPKEPETCAAHVMGRLSRRAESRRKVHRLLTHAFQPNQPGVAGLRAGAVQGERGRTTFQIS